jgi:membrane associated rhomboid family serine protease
MNGAELPLLNRPGSFLRFGNRFTQPARPEIRGAVVSGSRICTSCGKLNSAQDRRCGSCGSRLPSAWEVAARQRWAATFGGKAWATSLFMLLSVGIYLALAASSGELWQVRRAQTLRWGALIGQLGSREPWRYLSAMFVHFNLMHVGFNTLTLHSLGRDLEKSIGSARFILVFLGTGVGGFVASQLWYEPDPLTGGISGGIFGLLGVAVGWRYAQRDPEWKRLALTGVGYAVAMALIPGMQVNHAAHLGGLAVGAAMGWGLFRAGAGRRVDVALQGLAALLVAATLASVALSLASPVGRQAARQMGSEGPR